MPRQAGTQMYPGSPLPLLAAVENNSMARERALPDKGGAIPARLEMSEEGRPLNWVSSQAGREGVEHAVTREGVCSQ